MNLNKLTNKQIRPETANTGALFRKKSPNGKSMQHCILQEKHLHSSSQQFYPSLNKKNFKRNSLKIRDNLSSQKKPKFNKIQKGQNKQYVLDKFHKQLNRQQIQNQQDQPLIKQKNKIKTKNLFSDKNIKEHHKKNSFYLKSCNKPKISSIKTFIGLKLRKKLYDYFLFINLVNYNLRTTYRSLDVPKYKVYIEQGNNSKLIKKLFENRFWWNIVNKNENSKEVNLVWTQKSKHKIFNQIQIVRSVEADKNNIENELEFEKFKPETAKKQSFFSGEYNHLFHLLSQKDKKAISKKLSKKDSQFTEFRLPISKEQKKTFRKQSVHITHSHVENHQQLTNKKNLFYNLRQLFKQNVFSIVPLTFHLDFNSKSDDPATIFAQMRQVQSNFCKNQSKKQKSLLWIVKPGQNSNRGCGIDVFKRIDSIEQHTQSQRLKYPQRSYIIQKYINPFLYHRRKFDIRCFLLVTATPSIRAYYYPVGYIRTSSYEYSSKNCSNRFIHLTNDAIQKKNQQNYGKYQKGNKITYEDFQKYLDLFQGKKQLNFAKQILPRIRQAMLHTVRVMVSRDSGRRIFNPQNRGHSFQLFGYDFMIDQAFVPWLIEVNTNPCLETGCQVLQDIIPSMLQNVAKICIDTTFAPPKPQEWPLKQLLTCSDRLFNENKFQLIFTEDK